MHHKTTILFALMLASCAGGPSVTRIEHAEQLGDKPKPARTFYHATSGWSFIAKQSIDGVEIITKEGDTIRMGKMVQNSAGAVETYTNWWGLKGLASLTAHSTDLKTTTDGATKQLDIAKKAEVAGKKIDAGVATTAILNPINP